MTDPIVTSRLYDVAVLAAAIGSLVGLAIAVACELLEQRAMRQIEAEQLMRRGMTSAQRAGLVDEDLQ